jgi:retron-type reverse transcriptase
LEIDISTFFDNVPHDRVIKALEHHKMPTWVILYCRRWLRAPLINQSECTMLEREVGTPQGALCKALHNPPYAKKKIMQSNWTYASKNMNLDLIYSA